MVQLDDPRSRFLLQVLQDEIHGVAQRLVLKGPKEASIGTATDVAQGFERVGAVRYQPLKGRLVVQPCANLLEHDPCRVCRRLATHSSGAQPRLERRAIDASPNRILGSEHALDDALQRVVVKQPQPDALSSLCGRLGIVAFLVERTLGADVLGRTARQRQARQIRQHVLTRSRPPYANAQIYKRDRLTRFIYR